MSGSTPAPDGAPGNGAAAPEPRPGDRIGSYRLIRLIGEGATGRVFEVEHVTIGRKAAMKILAPEHATRPGAIKRLFAEARAVNRINHPHIVEVTDLVEAEREDSVNAIVMELLEGEPLSQLIVRGPVPPERFLPILAQVASALAAAHAARFVHRDLKPENIFLTTRDGKQDYVKLLDFGLAKNVVGPDDETLVAPSPTAPTPVLRGGRRSYATAEGTFVGTPAYASPEQAAGKTIDHRTDIYSLGVILYELLSGKLPFEAKNFGEYLLKHMTVPPPPLPAELLQVPLGRTLAVVASKCLAKAPDARWSSADELRAIFERLARAEAVVLTSDGKERRPVPRWAIGAGATAAIALAVALFASLGKSETTQPVAARQGEPGRGIVIEPLRADPVATVVITFESRPKGAETWRVDKGELLGITPFHWSFPAHGPPIQVEMRLPGHVTRRVSVPLSANDTVLAELSPAPVVVAPPAVTRSVPAAKVIKRPPKARRDVTLNPFAPR